MAERVIGGKYELRREIGRGGMGAVWEAVDLVLRRPVALKLMAPELVASESAPRLFEREATALAQIQNEHIVMELLGGEDLDSRLQREQRLSPAALLPFLRQIASGLTAAAAVGVVHRDLKPANIFLVRKDAGESLKILDFGIAWMLSEAEERAPSGSLRGLIGTPAYMSPEQVRGHAPHHQGDVWSLGVVLYKALTGRLPFEGESIGSMIMSICTDAFPPPTSIVPDLLPGVDRFFERALAKNRARRFQSARDLCEAFASLCLGPRAVKILVVDDEPSMELLMKLHFREEIRASAYAMSFAGDGQAALDELRRQPDIDVVLSDIRMPLMDGLTLLGRIAEVAPLAKTVMVSAYNDMDNIRRAMNEGAFDFLVKPITSVDLKATVKKAVTIVAEHRKLTTLDEQNRVLRTLTSSALLERLDKLGPSITLASEAVEMTAVFIDVFQFSGVAREKLPGELIRLLNANFEVIVPELVARGGVVNKYLGDAVMAVFSGEEHLRRALDACVAVQEQMRSLARRAGPASPYAHGLAMGISAGRVVAGCVGSHAQGRIGYTVIGEAVNEAANLTRVALGGEILVSARVRDMLKGQFALSEAGPRLLSPRADPQVVYSVRVEATAPR